MANVGLFSGLTASPWRTYDPILRGFSSAGSGITQPILTDPTLRKGKYLITNQGLVVGNAQITLAAGDTIGSGDSVWGFSLPARTIGQVDHPIGTAMLWQGAAANPSAMLIGQLTPMDPLLPGGSQGAQQRYGQVFLSKLMSWGTGAFASGATVVTVTHNLGETPVESDIGITWTNTPSTSPAAWWIDTITATTFNVNIRTSSTTTPATLSWKIDAEPNPSAGFTLLMSSGKPWPWQAGYSIGITFEYQLG